MWRGWSGRSGSPACSSQCTRLPAPPGSEVTGPRRPQEGLPWPESGGGSGGEGGDIRHWRISEARNSNARNIHLHLHTHKPHVHFVQPPLSVLSLGVRIFQSITRIHCCELLCIVGYATLLSLSLSLFLSLSLSLILPLLVCFSLPPSVQPLPRSPRETPAASQLRISNCGR